MIFAFSVAFTRPIKPSVELVPYPTFKAHKNSHSTFVF